MRMDRWEVVFAVSIQGSEHIVYQKLLKLVDDFDDYQSSRKLSENCFVANNSTKMV